MTDIYCGMSLMLMLAAACFVWTRRAVRGLPLLACDLLGLFIVAAICAHIRWLWDDIRLAQWLPYSNLIVISNWYVPLAGVLAGLAWRRIEQSPPRRWAAVLMLLGASLYATIQPVWGVPPHCEAVWEQTSRGRCFYQTTQSTCSAAAAATMLSQYGIPADEQEMAELCLTRTGTTWKGLFRGLVLKTAATQWNVEAFRSESGDSLKDAEGPLVLCARLPGDHPDARAYQREWGWIPDTSHTVVMLNSPRPGEFIVHDPVAGIEIWTDEDVRALWTGVGMRFVPRQEQRISAARPVAGLQIQ
ncbi:MAG: hypothetical protein U0992_19865 [Planctomycetaceae bacterium]